MSQFSVQAAPADALFSLMAKYKADQFDKKVDLGIGAYRDDDGKPWVLPVVKKAERLLLEDPNVNHEYLPIAGNAQFIQCAAKAILGSDISLDRVASVQTLSGTGANHVGALFLSNYHPYSKKETPTIHIPNPTWANHNGIFGHAGLTIKTYPYFDAATRGLDAKGMLGALSKAEKGDIVLLHACAHNPTGVDPSRDQWKQIAQIVQERQLFPFFDSAYQGFASGDLDYDAWAIRYFINQGIELLVCQSFSKNMGLYGERAGCLHIVVKNQEAKKAIVTQLEKIERAEVSNPPSYGARIAAKILSTPELFDEWKRDLKTMSSRIIHMREQLKLKLEQNNTPGSWNHIVDQIGMFSYTGLTASQVSRLVNEYHVYLVANGRISMAGLNSHNIDYVAKAFAQVVLDDQKKSNL